MMGKPKKYKTCTECDGSRWIECDYCFGEGVDDDGDPCSVCNGEGDVECPLCEGLGEIEEEAE